MAKRKVALPDLIFKADLLHGVACTTLGRSAMLRRVNAENPSGTRAGWMLSTRRIEGKRNPFPCLEDKARKHYLLDC
jgi:hypothetical protein